MPCLGTSMENPASSAPVVHVPTTAEEIQCALALAHTPDECLALALRAEESGDLELQRRCLAQALGLDRNCQPALIEMAAQAKADGDAAGMFAFVEEAARAGVLPDELKGLREELLAAMQGEPQLAHYLRVTKRTAPAKADESLSIVLVTNLFPPQELGGYGRMMWEFAHGLRLRGHRVRVLTSNVTEFAHQAPTADEEAMELHVLRSLELLGHWSGGKGVPITDRAEAIRRLRDNQARVRTALAKCCADLVLAGNLDFLGHTALEPALAPGIPVLHALANALPGYAVVQMPAVPHYWVAPCSDWNGRVFRDAGFAPARIETLYPGARVDRFFRLFLPDTRRLRICYASLVLPYKGADTLVHALARLHAAGVDFTAEIAGDAPRPEFLAELLAVIDRAGMSAKVRFTGFLDRDGLSALFARSNVLVFPSRFQEPFGISQVEAMAAGLAVVSSGTGGAKEIVRDGVDGLLFESGNDGELAAKLQRLITEPGLLPRLQRQGQTRAAVFSVDRAVLRIEQLAHELRAAIPDAEPNCTAV